MENTRPTGANRPDRRHGIHSRDGRWVKADAVDFGTIRARRAEGIRGGPERPAGAGGARKPSDDPRGRAGPWSDLELKPSHWPIRFRWR